MCPRCPPRHDVVTVITADPASALTSHTRARSRIPGVSEGVQRRCRVPSRNGPDEAYLGYIRQNLCLNLDRGLPLPFATSPGFLGA